MDSPNAQRTASPEARPHVPEEYVSNAGWSLIWIDAILLVPIIFGVMFLSPILRLLVASVTIAVFATYALLYHWARLYPAGASAHLLQALHVAPRRRIAS